MKKKILGAFYKSTHMNIVHAGVLYTVGRYWKFYDILVFLWNNLVLIELFTVNDKCDCYFGKLGNFGKNFNISSSGV